MTVLMTDQDLVAAPCLKEGPIALEASELVAASRSFGSSPWQNVMRAWSVPCLFHNMERIFPSESDPVPAIRSSLTELTEFFKAASKESLGLLNRAADLAAGSGSPEDDVERVTGEHYGRLFEAFADASFWDEPKKLLQHRLERNGVSLESIKGKTVLDAGCGGGRYTVAWRLLGAASAVGVDVSTTGLADARKRVAQARIDNVEFKEGNVLQLPFPDHAFDIVFSNGVLHHSVDWARGVHELLRVMKPGGLGCLYLIENPGGLFWDLIEILRLVTEPVSRDLARASLRLIGIPGNRIFYMLDHVMVPINLRLTDGEIQLCLSAAGARDLRRLTRGADFDRIEQIDLGHPYARVKYGVGEHRYVFSK